MSISLFSNTVFAGQQLFPDVKHNNSHFMGIHTLEHDGVINGYTEKDGSKRFRPDEALSRMHTAALFTRSLKLQIPDNKLILLNNYKDIDGSHPYADEIAATYKANIFTGSNNYFNADEPLNREQMASVLVRAYGLKDTGEQVNAKLSNIDPSHKENVKILFQHGITDQTGDYRPLEPVTRGQFATFLYRTAQQTDGKYAEMDVTFLDVGQGDSIFIQTTNGKNILIDAGTQSAGEKVVSYLKEMDVGKLDLVIATHPHADHIGGLIPVLNNFKVDKFVDSGKIHTSQTYYNLLSLIDDKNIAFEIPKIGQVYSIDDFKMTVIHVDSNASNINDASVSIKGEYDGVSFMLTGDAEQEAEQKMINSNFNLNSTIYKAGHHGSNTSSTPAFIKEVKPEVTILSYGKGNSYGHPVPEVVNRLVKSGSDIYATAQSGNINVATNGIVYQIEAKTYKPDQPKPEKPKPEKPKPEVTYPININKASYEQLQEIKGVGPAIAQRIINYRKKSPFKKKSDIKNIKGIGEKRYEEMKGQITV